MTTLMIFIKLCTVAAHFRLSLALSVPRNFITRTIKYMVVPGIVTYLLNRKNYNMAIENAEELKN
jgi:membrane protein YqaA with SNARE-associated domain